jgi:radical S-adenosyl methionine domain-containing protein 2
MQTNGNCTGLLIQDELWSDLDLGRSNVTTTSGTTISATSDQPTVHHPGTGVQPGVDGGPVGSSSDSVAVSMPPSKQPPLITVNWHLAKDCNYNCTFCYAHFQDIEVGLDKENGMRLIHALHEAGVFKVNFAGGEPFLNQHLGDFVKEAKRIGLKTSIITNASRMTIGWLEQYGKYLDQIGISCDSLDDRVNKALGRGFGDHVKITERALQRVRKLNEQEGLDIKVKLNTVVMHQNHKEDWEDFIIKNGVQRWKIFKVLRIEGENDHCYDELAVTDHDFNAFVTRHAHLSGQGVVMAPENNDDMTTSYAMVTPDGRFYQNTDGCYSYSEPLLDVGVGMALHQVGFDYAKFELRGGAYQL